MVCSKSHNQEVAELGLEPRSVGAKLVLLSPLVIPALAEVGTFH